MKVDTMVHRFIVLLTLILLVVWAWDSVYAENKVLSLDGDGDYMQFPEGVWFDGDLTIETWILVREHRYWSRIVDFAYVPGRDNVLFAFSKGNSERPQFCVIFDNDWRALDVASPLPLNDWEHLACTLSGQTGRIYINGIEVASGSVNVPKNVIRTKNYLGRSNWGA